jgi:hypothetical protein
LRMWDGPILLSDVFADLSHGVVARSYDFVLLTSPRGSSATRPGSAR